MTQPLGEAIRAIPGQPSSVRVGRVVGVDPLMVSVQGVTFNSVGTLGTIIPTLGMPVIVLGQSTVSGSDPTSWVVLGPAVTPFDGPNPTGDGTIPSMDNPPMARLRQTVIQSLPTGVSTPIIFDMADVDTVGGWNGAGQYVAQIDGRYQISGGVTFASNATGFRASHFRIDGIDEPGTGVLIGAVTGASTRVASRVDQLYLRAGQFFEIIGFQNTGAPLNTAVTGVEQSTMNVRWIGHA